MGPGIPRRLSATEQPPPAPPNIKTTHDLAIGISNGAPNATSTFTINNNGRVDVGRHVDVGSSQNGVLTIASGELTVAQTINVDGTGRVEHQGGTIAANKVEVKPGGHMRLHSGAIILVGNECKNENGLIEIEINDSNKFRAIKTINRGTWRVGLDANIVPATVAGDFEQTTDGTMEIQIAGPATHDVQNVVGNVTLAGALDGTVTYAPAPWTLDGTAGDYFAVVTATGSLTGEEDITLNLPDPVSLIGPPAPGRSYEWKVVNEYDPDLSPYGYLPWTTNGTQDLVLLIMETEIEPPKVRIDDVTVDEADGSAVFTVSLVDGAGASTTWGDDVTVYYNTWDDSGWDPYAASQPDDYTYTDDSVTILAGSSNATLSVPIVDDAMDEYDEVFHVAVSWAVNAEIDDGDGEATILDNDPEPSMSINDATGTEIDGYVEFTVTLSNASAREVTVDVTTADGTATAPDDYADYGYYGLTFSPGELTQSVWIEVYEDDWDEYDETFFVNLANPSGATLADGQGLGTIIDSDEVELWIEGNGFYEFEGTGTFWVWLSIPSDKTITVDYATADDTAVSPDDYAAASGTITFAPGELDQEVGVTLVDDGIDEYDEQFIVNLSNATEATLINSQAYGVIYGELYLTLDLPPKEPAVPIAPLTLAEVKPLVPEAVARWVAAGSDGKELRTALESVQFVIMDLPDSRLSAAHTGRILLDVDAAGYGWFVDATPRDDKEFERFASPSERQAGKGSPAAGHVDLLTAITHELGHLLGLPDLPIELVPHNIMADTIGLGTRRSPVRHQVAPDRPDSLSEPRWAADVVFREVGRREELGLNRGGRGTGGSLANRLLTEEEFVWLLDELLSYERVR